MQVLVTGSAGFIGFHLSKALLDQGVKVYGIDSLNHYYDISLKEARLRECGIKVTEDGKEYISDIYPNYTFNKINLCDKEGLEKIFKSNDFDCVINLAAQAGVRYSLSNPETYIASNVEGFLNLLENCRKQNCKRLIYASSSSVYGNSTEVPFKENQCVDHPISIYAATKKSNELMAYTYSSLYKIQTIGLRLFTVYGPLGRPDMAPILFARAIREDNPIKVFNNGKLSRDFTYIDDIVGGIVKIIKTPEVIREDTPGAPASIYNIGNGSPVQLMSFIKILEKNLGKTAQKEYIQMQQGDVYQTWADTSKLKEDYDYSPSTSLEKGIKSFTDWFNTYKF